MDRRVLQAEERSTQMHRGLGKLDILSNCSRLKQMPTGEVEDEAEFQLIVQRGGTGEFRKTGYLS